MQEDRWACLQLSGSYCIPDLEYNLISVCSSLIQEGLKLGPTDINLEPEKVIYGCNDSTEEVVARRWGERGRLYTASSRSAWTTLNK